MSGRRRRKTTLGTGVAILLTLVVLVSSGLVLLHLGSAHKADLSRLNMQVISLKTDQDPGEQPGKQQAEPTQQTQRSENRETQTQSAAPASETFREKQALLTFGGTIAIEENIRKSGYIADSKKYDFSDIFMLLSPELQGRTAGAFLENLIMENARVSATVIPPAGAEMMKASGFSVAFSGFSKAWDKAESGIAETIGMLESNGIRALGICRSASGERILLQDINGIRIAMMQYTDTLSSGARKAMQKKDLAGMIPEADPELIASDIAAARAGGADAVLVFLNWGKTGGKTPDKAQTILAQQIADSGADLIIGAGSRVPQKVEYLLTPDGRQVLCAYSLGTLISDNRKTANRMGGFLLHVQLNCVREHEVQIGKATYTPTYVWKYRQDGKDSYRVVASDRAAPDGMANDQIKQMQKTLSVVQEALQGAPVEIR